MNSARILIVEDEIITAMAMQSDLEALSYQVISVENTGKKAIKKAEQEAPDIILMDINLKGEMDGITTADTIQSSFKIPIIFITAYADTQKLNRAKKILPLAYLLKPVQANDLKIAIEMALHISRVNTQKKKAEEDLLKKTHDLRDRIKELNCLYAISELIEKPDLSLSQLCQEVINLIPTALHYPNISSARLILENQEFKTKNFIDTTWKLTSTISVRDEDYGTLEICYPDRRREIRKKTFLKEERSLINEISERLGKIIEKMQAEEALKNANHQLQLLPEQLKEENIYLQEEIKQSHNFGEIISKNRKYLKILKTVEKVAVSKTTVLILGETGTGKELIARLVHQLSDRKNQTLVKVNCATLPANLIESELFGHEKGAFTGAVSSKKGRFELADKGTIFLDEIGDLPLDLQAKLLRVLQDNEFEKIGGTKTLKVDVRVLAATNKNLESQCEEGRFRPDLFYRLNVFPIESMPLRKRNDDIPILLRHFIKIFNKKTGKKIESVPKNILDILQSYHWPGNIRELENIIERAVILSTGNQLELGDWLSKNKQGSGKASILTLDDLQKEHIIHVLNLTNGKVGGKSGAANLLGLSRTTLQSRMKKLGVAINKNTSEME
ncbi:MAG: sigma 54-interacting transcriptional regulator [Deltaproteobacteria bacterium]|nr:sigma 54-interacting transcriptional regulator [Deltaproteobacteria bacterium]